MTDVVEQHRDRQHGGGRVRDTFAGDVGCAAVHRLEHARRSAVDVEVAAGSEPDAAGNGRAEVSDDVAEQVVRDDDIESRRVGYEVEASRINVRVVDLHF